MASSGGGRGFMTRSPSRLTSRLSGLPNTRLGAKPTMTIYSSFRHEGHHTPLEPVVRLPHTRPLRSCLSPLAREFPVRGGVERRTTVKTRRPLCLATDAAAIIGDPNRQALADAGTSGATQRNGDPCA